MKHKFYFLVSSAMSAVIAVLLLLKFPGQEKVTHVRNGDKFIHAFLFLLLAWLVYHDARKARLPQWGVYLTAALWSILWGGAMELIQGYCLSYRTGSWWDWVADIIGVAIGVALARVWQKK